MKIRTCISMLLWICILTCLACGTNAEERSRTASDVLTELRSAIEQVSPPPEVRVKACVELLEREISSPCTPVFGIGGGPIDTTYIKAVITGSVCTFAQKGTERLEIRECVRQTLQATPESKTELRHRLLLMLAYTGDKSVAPQLASLIKKADIDPSIRQHSAILLGDLKAKEYIPLLKQILSDPNNKTPVHISFGSDIGPDPGRLLVKSMLYAGAIQGLNRLGEKISDYSDIVENRYGVERVKPLLSEKSLVCYSAIEVLGLLDCDEAQQALADFIKVNIDNKDRAGLVARAREVLSIMDQRRAGSKGEAQD